MMFTEWDGLDRFDAAAEAGFTAVEILFPYEHRPERVAERLRRSGLTIALINLPPGDWSSGERGLGCLAGREADFRASLNQAIDYALATGVRRLHVMAGLGAPNDPRADAAYRAALQVACAAAAPHGIDILIEPLNGRDMPGYFLCDFAQAERIIRDLALPNLRLQFDIYHRQILHGDVVRGLERTMPLIGHVQIASVPLRHEPGTGELDDHHLFEQLDALGYAGFVGCEYRPRAGTLQGLGWLRPA